MLKEYVKFTDNLSVQIFEESKHNTSLKDQKVKSFFNDTFSIYTRCKLNKETYVANEHYGLFAKQGMHSGVWLKDNFVTGLLFCQDENNNIVEYGIPIRLEDAEFFDEIQILFQYNAEENKLKLYVNGQSEELLISKEHKLVDYIQAPFWIGACAPWYSNDLRWFFNGEIYEFSINEKYLSIENVNQIFENKGYENLINSELNESLFCWFEFTIRNFSRFKVFDKSNNGNHGIVPDWHYTEVRAKLQSYSKDRKEISEFGVKLKQEEEVPKKVSKNFNLI